MDRADGVYWRGLTRIFAPMRYLGEIGIRRVNRAEPNGVPELLVVVDLDVPETGLLLAQSLSRCRTFAAPR